MLGRLRMPIEKAIMDYEELVKAAFSEVTWTTGKLKATQLEYALQRIVRDVTGDANTPLEDDATSSCRTWVAYLDDVCLAQYVPIASYAP